MSDSFYEEYYPANPFYAPKKNGLELLGELDFSSGSYEFDYTAVWKDLASGQLRWADDSGCSCPSPFETHSVESLEHGSFEQLRDHLRARRKNQYTEYVTAEELDRFLDKVKGAL